MAWDSGTQRVASKLGVGDFNNLFVQGSTYIPEKLSGWSAANKRFTYLNPELGNVVFQLFC